MKIYKELLKPKIRKYIIQFLNEQNIWTDLSSKDIQMAAAAAKSLQSCPTLCDPIDSSPPGSPVSGILQARTLEWVAISFSNAGKWKVKVKSLGRIRLVATPWTAASQAPPSMGFSMQEYWSGLPLPSPIQMANIHVKSVQHQVSLLLFSPSVTSNTFDSMDYSTPDFPVLHYLLELAQIHVHWVGGAIQPSHPLLSPSPPTVNLSQH